MNAPLGEGHLKRKKSFTHNHSLTVPHDPCWVHDKCHKLILSAKGKKPEAEVPELPACLSSGSLLTDRQAKEALWLKQPSIQVLLHELLRVLNVLIAALMGLIAGLESLVHQDVLKGSKTFSMF